MNQSFSEKVFNVIIAVFFLKVIVILIYSNDKISDLLFALLIFFIIAMVIIWTEESIDKANNSFSGKNGQNAIINDSLFDQLEKKYRAMAEKYEKENNHKKAAFIYMKLLKNNYDAAQVLERGKLYNEAAVIYHKKLENKQKAAECYENGKSYQAAIKLYLELDEPEKLGDLYRKINNEPEAIKYYTLKVEDYKTNNQYIKASLLLKKKLFKTNEAQELLLEGWNTNRDAKNCLNNYFANIEDINLLTNEIQNIYQNNCKTSQYYMFLDLLKIEFNKNESLQKPTRDIAYEIISKKATEDKNILNVLNYFKPKDTLIKKDVLKYKTKKK